MGLAALNLKQTGKSRFLEMLWVRCYYSSVVKAKAMFVGSSDAKYGSTLTF